MGDPPGNMASALKILDSNSRIEVAAVSRLYRTPPWGNVDQDWFYNSCASVNTSLTAHQLLDACLATEVKLKRVRKQRWGPRTIDIDVLTYDSASIHEDGLSIPHPHMHERAFVLLPLNDIAASVIIQRLSVSQWMQKADSAGIECVSEDDSWWKNFPIKEP